METEANNIINNTNLTKETEKIPEINLEKENDWNSKRRIYYVSGIVFLLFSFVFYKSYDFIFPAPTCFDKKQNSAEGGIDCGGACELMCKDTYSLLEIKLAKAFKAGVLEANNRQAYDFLILLDNKNIKLSPKKLTVNIDIYGSNGNKLDSIKKELTPSTFKQIPILINNYTLPDTVDKSVYITKLFVNLDNYDMYHTNGAYDVRLLDYKFEDSNTPKLSLAYTSPYKEIVKENITLLILLKDALDNVVGYNKKDITALYPEKKIEIDLSWKESVGVPVKNIELIPMSYLFYK